MFRADRIVIPSNVKSFSVNEAFYMAWVITSVQPFQMNLKFDHKLGCQLNSPGATNYVEKMMRC